MNFISLDRIKYKILKTGHDDHSRIRLVHFATLIRRVLQIERPINQSGNDARCGGRTVPAYKVVNPLKIIERRPCPGGLSSGVAAVERGQFLVGDELTATRSIHAFAYGGTLFVGQAEHIITPPFDLRFCHLAQQVFRESSDPFEQIMPFRAHRHAITWRQFPCPRSLVYDGGNVEQNQASLRPPRPESSLCLRPA